MVDSDSENDEDLENNLNSNKDYPLVKDIQTVYRVFIRFLC